MKVLLILFLAIFYFPLLGQNHEVHKVTREEIYEFINQKLHDSTILLNRLFVVEDTSEIMDAVRRDTSLFRLEDVSFIQKQLEAKNMKLRKSKLTKTAVRLIPWRKVKRYFRRKNLVKGWEKFHKKVGPSYEGFGIPLFSVDKQVVIFTSWGSCGPLCGGGDICIYKKVNGKWEFHEIISMWMS